MQRNVGNEKKYALIEYRFTDYLQFVLHDRLQRFVRKEHLENSGRYPLYVSFLNVPYPKINVLLIISMYSDGLFSHFANAPDRNHLFLFFGDTSE